MNETTNIPLAASGVRWLWIAAFIIVLDQLSKLWVQGSMELYESIEVLPVLNIYHTFNRGAAWSFTCSRARAGARSPSAPGM